MAAPAETTDIAATDAPTRNPDGLIGPIGPITPEEIADRLVPSDAQLSPDGGRVLFTVAPGGRAGEHQESTIWIAGEASEPRPFSAGTAHDAHPRWSPDGQRVAFISDRIERGESRLFLIHAGGGEARPLGDLQGEMAPPVWSPDGRWIAILVKEPIPAAEKARHEARDDADLAGAGLRPNRLWVVDATGGKARQLTFGQRQVWSVAWTPDDQHIVTLTTGSADPDTVFAPGDLWRIPATGGVPHFVARFPVLPGDPVVVDMPGGPVVAIRANAHRADPSDSVWTVPLAGGEPVKALPDMRGVVEHIAAAPGHPGEVVVRIVEGTHAAVYRLALASGELTPITPADRHGRGTVVGAPSLSADGKTIALVWSDGDTPDEVWLGTPGGAARALTTFGTPFRGRLGRVETVHWPSDDGVEIEGMLVLPAGHRPDQRVPLIVEIHGGPSWQWEERTMLSWHDWAQMLAGRGYASLAPNPRGSTGYGSAFQTLLQDDVGGGEARDLISGARAMVERGIADPDRLGVGGWSWGGYLTAWTITQTTMFRAAVMGAGLANMVSDHGQNDIPSMNDWIFPGHAYDHLDHYWQASPIRHIDRVTTPTLILHGAGDDRVHPAQAMEYHRALKTRGVPVEFVRYPREGHGIKERLHQIDLMGRIIAWYDRWLVPGASPAGDGPRAMAPGDAAASPAPASGDVAIGDPAMVNGTGASR
ncbi:MAG: S9 family peptidase [Thermomicrobiales bacterium]